MALKVKTVVPDRSHSTKCPGVLKDGCGRFAVTEAGDRSHDAVAKTLKCEQVCEAMRQFNHRRRAGM